MTCSCTSNNSIKLLVSTNRTLIMGIAMVLVVLFHQPFENEGILWEIFHRYGYWGADMFLFISGMGIVNSLGTHTIRRFYLNRCWRILPACVINGAVVTILHIMSKDGIDSLRFPIWFYLTSMTYWYITAIIVYYALAPFFFFYLKKIGWLFVVLSTLLALLYIYKIYQFLIPFFFTYRWYVEMVVGHIPVFILGMYIGINDVKSKSSFLILSTLAFITAVIVTEDVGGITNLVGSGYIFVLIMGAMPFLILSINCIARFCPDRFRKGIEWIGCLTLEIYLLHDFAFQLVYNFEVCKKDFLKFPISIVLSLFLALFLQKITQYVRTLLVKIVD